MEAKVDIGISQEVRKAFKEEFVKGKEQFEKDVENSTVEIRGVKISVKNFDDEIKKFQKKIQKAYQHTLEIKEKAENKLNKDKELGLIRSNSPYDHGRQTKDVAKIKETKNEKIKDDTKAFEKLLIDQKKLFQEKENLIKGIKELNSSISNGEIVGKDGKDNVEKKLYKLLKLEQVVKEAKKVEETISKYGWETIPQKYSGAHINKSDIPEGNITKYIKQFQEDLQDIYETVYNKNLKRIEAEKKAYIEKNREKIDSDIISKNTEKTVSKAKGVNVPELENKIAQLENENNKRIKDLEQRAIKSIEQYIKVADQTDTAIGEVSDKIIEKVEQAFKDISKYANSGGNLDNLYDGLENILRNNPDWGTNDKALYDERVADLQEALKDKEFLKGLIKDYETEEIIGNIDTEAIDKGISNNITKIKEYNSELENNQELINKVKEAARKLDETGQFDNIHTGNQASVESGKASYNNEIPVSIVPEVEPEEFVGKITEQLKGHSVKVDVEPNENIQNQLTNFDSNVPLLTDEAGKVVEVFRGVKDSYSAIINDGKAFFTSSKELASDYADSLSTEGKVYKANLALKKPFEIDGNGAIWDRVEFLGFGENETSKEIIQIANNIAKVNNQIEDINKKANKSNYKNKLEELNKQLQELQIKYQKISDDTSNMYGTHSTDGFVELAKKNGYDGAIFKNIRDGFTDAEEDLSNVFVAFDERQIKNIDVYNRELEKTLEHSTTEIAVNVKPEFDADEFIQDITSKLKGKEVPIDITSSEASNRLLDRLSAYSEKMNILSKEDIEQLVNKQDIPLNVTPKLETPENFAKEVTNQLKGTSAKIDVKPQITDKAISDLLKEQTKSKNVSVSAPKLNAKNLIEEFNLQGKDIDSNITSKVRDLSKEINKLSKEAVETNSNKSWEGLVNHIKELANILNSYGKIRLDTAQFESVLKIAEQLKGSRIFIGDNVKNDVLSGASADNLRQLNNEFINLGVTFTTTRDKAINLDDVWDEFIQSTSRMDLSEITTGAERISVIIEELREAKNVLYGDKGLISADKFGSSEMITFLEEVDKKQKEYVKANPNNSEEYQKNIEFLKQEVSIIKELYSGVEKVTASVDEKTNAFREEEQVVTGTVQREISELERLSGELVSVRDDIEKITSAITTLPKIDFDVDLSKLNIENIDGAAIASFNSFREQLAGLEAQLNVSNLSEKLVHISEAFKRLSRIENLENLNTKNLNITPIIQLAEKAGSITELVEALNRLKECLDGLKTTSFDKDYFAGLKLSAKNVSNMADMAVALETVGIALQKFDADAKESLSSINELLDKSEALKDISSFVKNSGKESVVSIDVNDNIVLEDILPSDKQFKNTISNLDMVEAKMMDIVKITKKSKKDKNGNFIEDYVVNYGNGSSETYRKDANSNKAFLTNSSYVKFDAKAEEKAMLEVQKQITKEIDEQTAEQQKIWKLFLEEIEVQEQITKEIEKQNKAQQEKGRAFIKEQEKYISDKQEAEAISKNARAYKELTDTIQNYSDVKKRIAKGEAFDRDVEQAEILEQKISELQRQPILNTSQIEESERSLRKLYNTLDTLEKKAKENSQKVKTPTASTVNKSTSISDNISNGTYQKDIDEVTARFGKLNKEIKYNEDLMKQLNSAYDKLKNADGVESKTQAYREFEKALASARNELLGLEKKSKGLNLSEKLNNQLNEIKDQYSGVSYLSSSLNKLEDDITAIQEKAKVAGADLTTLAQDARQAFAAFSKGILPSGDVVGSFNNLDEAIEQAKSVVNQYGKVKTELKTPLQVNDNGIAKMTAQVVDLNGELKTLTFVYNDVTKTMVKQTTNIRKELSGIPGVIDAVKSKLKDMAVYWTATMFDPSDIMFKLREIADVVIDLNTQMTELAKVSGLSIDQLEGRFNDWANTAKDLGATISDTISAASDWSRLGYSVSDAEKLAEVSILYKNVGDGISIDEANESLVSTLQGFQLAADQAEHIIDVFNEVSKYIGEVA